jgi:hypothetical protein
MTHCSPVENTGWHLLIINHLQLNSFRLWRGGGLLCRIFSGEFSVMTNPESTVDSGDEQEDSHGYDDD